MSVLRSARLGVRVLVRAPIVSALAILSIAIAIAGDTRVFSLVDAMLPSALSGTSPFGASTAALVGLGLFGVALLACYVPARRASSLHPGVALRSEETRLRSAGKILHGGFRRRLHTMVIWTAGLPSGRG